MIHPCAAEGTLNAGTHARFCVEVFFFFMFFYVLFINFHSFKLVLQETVVKWVNAWFTSNLSLCVFEGMLGAGTNLFCRRLQRNV